MTPAEHEREKWKGIAEGHRKDLARTDLQLVTWNGREMAPSDDAKNTLAAHLAEAEEMVAHFDRIIASGEPWPKP